MMQISGALQRHNLSLTERRSSTDPVGRLCRHRLPKCAFFSIILSLLRD